MKKFATIIFAICMIACLFLAGSCSPKEPLSLGDGPVIQEAAAPGLLPREGGINNNWDSTAFLVGEFTDENGRTFRFNGLGELTVIRLDGSSAVGSYSLTEYGSGKAEAELALDGQHSVYTFDLCSAEGDFTLTDKAGQSFRFVPVEY